MATRAQKIAAARLLSLAGPRIGDLKPAEEILLRSAAIGEPAELGPDYPYLSIADNVKTGPRHWGPEREVRADVIRWLCVDDEAKKHVDPVGLRLSGARITGELNLSYAKISFPIDLTRCWLTADARLIGCQIPMLSMTGSWTLAIAADGAHVKYSMFLDVGFRADGEVSLNGVQIGVLLSCTEGTFINPGGAAIEANQINVGGPVFLRAGSEFEGKPRRFHAEGTVWLVGARVGGDLDCSGGEFLGTQGDAIHVARAQVRGTVFLRSRTLAEGGGNLTFKAVGTVNLQGTTVGNLEDDPASWNTSSRFTLDGFVYNSVNPADSTKRLEWLELNTTEATQPYRQLANVLRDSGDAKGAVQVLQKMEERISAKDRFPLRWLKASIGYGYQPENALGGLVDLTTLGWLVYWRAHRLAMTPSEKTAAQGFTAVPSELPPEYPRFNSFFYSIENTFPLVKLGLTDKWQANPEPGSIPLSAPNLLQRFLYWTRSPSFIRVFIWIQILLGWVFATLFLVALSGIIQHA